jgi:hypothetical protein
MESLLTRVWEKWFKKISRKKIKNLRVRNNEKE